VTRRSSARAGSRRQTAPPAAPPVVPRASAEAAGGRLTKMSAKVNSEVSRAKGKSAKAKPRTRRDKKGLVLYVDPRVTVALRRLSLDTGASVQELGMDALNLLFEQHGVKAFPRGGEETPPDGER
jgi:hypothetical protein